MATEGCKDVVKDVVNNVENEQSILPYKLRTPANAQKEGRMRRLRKRIRDPFNKQKIKQLQQTVGELENLKKENERLKHIWYEMLITNQHSKTFVGSIGCLQIDCENNIAGDNTEIQQSMDELTDATRKVLKGVTKENEELLKELSDLKNKLNQCSMKIDETKDILTHYSSKYDEHSVETSRSLDKMRALLESIQGDKTDKEVFIDGINEIRLSMITKEEYNFLPVHAKHMVSRLIHLFGPSGLSDLCNALNTRISNEVIEASMLKDKEYQFDEQTSYLPLTRDACSLIILEWLNKASSHDGIVLHNAVKIFERKRLQRFQLDFATQLTTNTINAVQHVTTEDGENETETARSNSTGSSDSYDISLCQRKHMSIGDSYFSFSSLEHQRLQLEYKSEEEVL